MDAYWTSPFPVILTLILMWRIWWAPNNDRKWQMGFNLVFKGLKHFFGYWRCIQCLGSRWCQLLKWLSNYCTDLLVVKFFSILAYFTPPPPMDLNFIIFCCMYSESYRVKGSWTVYVLKCLVLRYPTIIWHKVLVDQTVGACSCSRCLEWSLSISKQKVCHLTSLNIP